MEINSVMPGTLIIIPTYNERENIERLIVEIFRHAPGISVLVVDDDSPDGTADIVAGLGEKDGRVSVLRRTTNRGRGLAGIDGFKEAIKKKDISYVIEMDGDFSHDPTYIPQFLKEAENYDVVIGSRYVKGGRDDDRGPLRVFLSISVNFFIRKYLGLGIKDCSSGYRCFRKEVLESLDPDNMISREPSIIEEVIYNCKLRNYRIKEIPILFRRRTAGKSKLGICKLIKVFRDIIIVRASQKNSFSTRSKNNSVRASEASRELRRFGFNVGLGLNILGCIMFYRHRPHFIWFTSIGIFILILTILFPRTLTPLKKAVDKIIFAFGWIVSTLSLFLTFYLVFTPISILLKFLRKDLLNQKINRTASSYWIEKKGSIFSKELYERMG